MCQSMPDEKFLFIPKLIKIDQFLSESDESKSSRMQPFVYARYHLYSMCENVRMNISLCGKRWCCWLSFMMFLKTYSNIELRDKRNSIKVTVSRDFISLMKTSGFCLMPHFG